MVKRNPPYTRELESFTPAVLAEFIRSNVPMLSEARTKKVFAELIHIEARQRVEAINEEIDQLIAKGISLHGPEHIKKYLSVQEQINTLWKEHDIALNIAFPLEPAR